MTVLLKPMFIALSHQMFKVSLSVTTNLKTVPLEFENNVIRDVVSRLWKHERNIFTRFKFTLKWN